MTIEKLLKMIFETPSIKKAIENGEFTQQEAEAEYREQLEFGEVEKGLIYVEDLSPELRAELNIMIDSDND